MHGVHSLLCLAGAADSNLDLLTPDHTCMHSFCSVKSLLLLLLLLLLLPLETGYLITPEHTNSYDVMALGRYQHINAFLNATQLCAAVDAVMTTPFVVRRVRGWFSRKGSISANC
jgi:hypothetical protein